mmetsp:Transcript_1368/g.5199  ORF Transcript_1368/g.5199 Transcript_1368/m.5199 type:complete len:126 (+) Transcript_1368:2319-2696(+)
MMYVCSAEEDPPLRSLRMSNSAYPPLKKPNVSISFTAPPSDMMEISVSTIIDVAGMMTHKKEMTDKSAPRPRVPAPRKTPIFTRRVSMSDATHKNQRPGKIKSENASGGLGRGSLAFDPSGKKVF